MSVVLKFVLEPSDPCSFIMVLFDLRVRVKTVCDFPFLNAVAHLLVQSLEVRLQVLFDVFKLKLGQLFLLKL